VWSRVTHSRGICPGDTVRTSDVDTLTLRFPNGTIALVGYGSLATFAADGTGPKLVKLDRGSLRVKLRPKGTPLAVHFAQGTATALGTDFELMVDPGRDTHIAVFRGAVRVQSRGASLVVRGGFSSGIAPNRAPSPPQRLTYMVTTLDSARTVVRWVSAEADRRVFLARMLAGRLNCGISWRDLLPGERSALGTAGVLVTHVRRGSPAYVGGVKRGDIILSVGGRSVRDSSDIQSILAGADPWSTLRISIRRGERGITTSLPADDRFGAPEVLPPQLLRANALAVRFDYARAEAAYRALLDSHPGCAAVHNNLAAVLERRGDLPAALEHYSRAASLNPSNALYHYNTAAVLAAAGNIKRAEQEYARASKLSAWWASPALGRARALLFLGRLAEARASVAVAEQRAHGDPEVELARAELLWVGGSVRQALASARRAAEGGAPEARLLEGILLISLGDYRDALRALQDGLRRSPNDPDILDALALAHLRSGQTAKAVEAYRTAAARAPERTGIRANMALALLSMGKTAQAIAEARAAAHTEASLGLSDGPGQQTYSALLLRHARPEEAEDQLRRLRNLDPDSISACVALHMLMLGRGNRRAAQSFWADARALNAEEAVHIKQRLSASGATT